MLQAVDKGDFVTDVNTLPTPASLRPRATCASSGSPLCRKRGSGRERSNERKKSLLALSRFSRSPLSCTAAKCQVEVPVASR